MADTQLQFAILGDASQGMEALSKFGDAVKGTTGQVTGAFDGLSSVIGKFAAPIAAITAAMGGGKLFGDAVSKTVELTGEVNRLSKVMGISRESASVLSVAIDDVFGSVDQFLAGAGKLVGQLGKNEKGIQSLGVATRDAAGHFRPMTELIPDINKRLGEFKEGIDRDMAAKAAYGKSWQDMMRYFALTPAVMEEAKKKAEELHRIIGDDQAAAVKRYRLAMQDVKDIFEALALRVGNEIIPKLTGLAEWFAEKGPGAINVLMSSLRFVESVLGNTVVQIAGGTMAISAMVPVVTSLALKIPLVTTALEMYNVQMALAASGGITGFRAALGSLQGTLTSMISPWVLAGAAIVAVGYGLSAWAQSYSKESADAAEQTARNTQAETEHVRALGGHEEAISRLEGKLTSSTPGSKAYEAAKKGINAEVAKMLEIYPDLLGYLQKENGAYVDVSESMEKYRKHRIKMLELDIEESKRKAAEARADNADALNTNIISYALVYKGVAENAVREQEAHEKTTKELEKQLGILKGQEAAAAGKNFDGAETSESGMAKLRSLLEKKKLAYEEDALNHGQYLQFSKQQEEEFWRKHLHDFAANTKERGEVEKAYFEAKRAVMLEGHKAEMDTLENQLKGLKDNYAARAAVIEEYRNKSASPEDTKKANELKAQLDADIAADERKAAETRLVIKRNEQLALLDIDKQELEQRRALGLITETELLQQSEALEVKKYDIAVQAIQDRIDLARAEGTLTKEAYEKAQEEIGKLTADRAKGAQANGNQQGMEARKGSGELGLMSGMVEWSEKSTNYFDQFKNTGLDAINSVSDAMAQGMQQMILHGGSMGQALKGIWTSLSQSVVQSLTKMASQLLINWAIEKMIATWKSFTTKQQIAEGAAGTAAQVGQDQTKQASGAATAGQGFFAAFASVPWVGFALAVAAIVGMYAFLGNAKAHAKGGVIDKPTLALMGEIPGSTEIVANERDFKNWAATQANMGFNLGQNIASMQRQSQAYDIGSSNLASDTYATRGQDRRPVHNDFRGALIADYNDTRLQELVFKSHEGYQRNNG